MGKCRSPLTVQARVSRYAYRHESHAREGAAVLYLCFNKVLATEQRREFQILGDKNENKGFIHSHDVYEFFKLYAGILPEMDWSTKIDKLLE